MGKYGKGVYLLDLDPHTDKDTLSSTLFACGAGKRIQQGRLDHYVALKIPENMPSQVRQIVYVYKNGDLPLRKYDVVSQGRNIEWTNVLIGMIAVAAAIKAADALYHQILQCKTVSERKQRLEQLELALKEVMLKSSCGSGYTIEHVTAWDGCLKCKICSARVTKVYESGIQWASSIYPSQVLGLLNEHHVLHKNVEEEVHEFCRLVELPPATFAIEWSESSSPTRVTGRIRCCRCDAFASTMSELSLISVDLLWHEFFNHSTWRYYILAAALCIPTSCVVVFRSCKTTTHRGKLVK